MKLKYNAKNDTFAIKGMSLELFHALITMAYNTKLGDGLYELAVAELVEASAEFEYMGKNWISDCVIDVDHSQEAPAMIILSHLQD
jgi:hypothetical protein